MLGSKFFSSLPVLPPATLLTEPRPRRPVAPSSSLPDEASSQTAEPGIEPQRPRPSRGSAQLNRWSRARSIRSGRRLDRPAILKDADASPNSTAPSSRSAEALLSIPADEGEDEGEGETALGKAIYMVSDGTGWTAEHSVNAALGQFEHCLVDRGCPVNTHLFSGVISSSVSSLCSAASLSSHPPTQSLKPSQQLKRKTPNSSEFSVLLQSCINARSLQEGRKLHVRIREAGFERNRDLLPKFIKLYVVCGRIDIARELFDGIPKRNLDTFTWTAMISGYVKNGTPGNGLMLFQKMLQAGLKPDSHTFSTLLKGSTDLGLLQLTVQLHSMALKYECSSCLSVANSLIYAYGSFGEVHRAREVFDRIPLRDVVSWSTMIRVCSFAEHYAESLTLFTRMQLEERIKPNEVTIVSLLPACGFFSSLRRGQAIHTYIIQNGFETNLFVGSALITMYSRCGDPDGAFTVFNSLGKKNVILWTSMIEGFSLNGKFAKAWELFQKMQEKGIRPTYVTMVVILSACSHGGLVDEGLEIFESMREEFGIEPRVEHYACIVDMLGRKGRLDDAEKFIGMMDMTPTGSVLGPLLGACQVHRNVEIGERLAYKLFELEPTNAANYVILSNIYASVGRWDDVGRLRERMVLKGLSKSPGCSWIEIKEKVYVFGAHDTSHLESENIYKLLKELGDLLINAGYMPSTKFVYLDVEEDDKKKLLCSHSERLAIAFGLLKAPPAVPIRIAKNIRVCGDCHDVIKLISKVTSRQLIIRDTNRFHHFSQGSCSCGDYW